MSMSKKDFIALADVMRPVLTVREYDGDEALVTLDMVNTSKVIDGLMVFMRRQNPAFMSERWFDYLTEKCGPGGGKVKK